MFFFQKKHPFETSKLPQKWGERPLQRFAVATIQRNRHAQGIVADEGMDSNAARLKDSISIGLLKSGFS